MTCHPINKAAMKQNCVEVLNQCAQLLEGASCLLEFHLKVVISFYFY